MRILTAVSASGRSLITRQSGVNGLNTDDLISLLAQDAPVRVRLGRALMAALMIGASVSAIVLVSTVGIRANMVEALQTSRVDFKIALTLILAIVGCNLVFRIGRPGVAIKPHVLAFFLPLVLLLAGILAELFVLPAVAWKASMIGRYSNFCLVFIPLLSLTPFMAFFWALKHGAPENPGLAGAVAGLAAGGIGAAIYAWHCPDDSPLFVGSWYMIAIAIMTSLGYVSGRRWLRW
ncbi:DUF1109 domain-containing protein [Neorhizobium petrolearium]|uniref:DUF1109 domain-containing protein n=1 Tax=Neorhizobium petrolearium TaxID=515361 RepID=UPI002D8029EE|nr:DUF1109 domain-containing protein [Neorhizobium petrolearium]